MTLRPLPIADRVIDEYESYLRTEFRARDPKLRGDLESALREAGFLARDPFFQAHRPFREGLRWEELRLDRALAEVMLARTGKERAYLHQSQAISHLLGPDAGPLGVTTGTGSGKTECFLLPVIQNAIEDAVRFKRRGLTALLVYPMNALANDQQERIEAYLEASGHTHVKVARYDRSTRAAERAALRRSPPHILLTNYVMLEYLLIRPADRDALWANHRCRFVVLDEVHTYRGALGSNIALLFRRLRAHLKHARQDWRTDDRADHRRFPQVIPVATSATIKSVDESNRDPEEVRALRDAAVQKFLYTLTGDPAASIRVIGESYVDIVPPGDAVWPSSPAVVTPPPVDDEAALRSVLASLAEADATLPLPELSRRAGILWALSDIVSRKPMSLDGIVDAVCEQVPERLDADRAAVRREVQAALVAGAALPDDCPGALRLRVHRFIRGGWQFTRCIDPQCGRLHPKGEVTCATCHRRTAPLYICRSCGADTLRFFSRDPEEAPLEPSDGNETEDEWMLYERQRLEPDEGELGGGRKQMKRRPILMGSFDVGSCEFSTDDSAYELKVMLAPGRNTCMVCGSSAGAHAVLSPVRLGTSAAVRVLAEGLVEGLAEQNKGREGHDGKERLLIFSDSRQDAAHQARFISYAGRYDRMRRRVLRALADAPGGRLTLEETITRLLALGVEAGDNATLGRGDDDIEFLNKPTRARALAWEEAPLLDDLAITASFRASIFNLGLVGVRYDKLERYVEKKGAGVAAELGLSPPQLVVLCRALLDELRRRGILSRPLLRYHPASPDVPESFKKADWERRIAHPFGLACEESGDPAPRLDADILPAGIRHINAWKPPKQGGGRPGLEKRFRQLLERMGGADATWERLAAVLEFMSAGPGYLTLSKLHGHRKTHSLLQVNADTVSLERVADEDRRRCSVCNVVMPWVTPGTPCPRCPGRLELWDVEDVEGNRYVQRILNAGMHALHAAEHTAQVTGEERIELEADFKAPPPGYAASPGRSDDGRRSLTNVLACSPTLEMGIDVGGLDAVVMRNVPPRPDNYAQRGGRAGRRSRVGLVMGYARNTPHDGYFFDQPAEMIAGEVAAPGVGLGNLDVLKRHLAAIVFGLAEPALAGRMAAYINIKGEKNAKAIDELIKGLAARLDEAAELAFEAWSTGVLKAAGISAVSGLRVHLDDLPQRVREVFNRVRHQITTLQQTIERWNEIGKGDYAAVNAQRLKRRLLGLSDEHGEEADDRTGGHPMRRLAEFGILPGYEFPSEPATLRLWGDKSEEEPIRVGRRFGLGQYQPDAIVHARGQRWKVVGLDLASPFNFHTGEGDWLYNRCKGCDLRYDFDESECPRCGDSRCVGTALPGHEFGGFLAFREDRPVLQEEDRFAIRALVQCHPQWDGDLIARFNLPTGWSATVRHEEAVRWVNEWKPPTPIDIKRDRPYLHDKGRGFYLCPSCGRMLSVPDEESSPAKKKKGRRKTRKGDKRDVYGHASSCERVGQPPAPIALVTETKATTLRFLVTLPGELREDDYARWGYSLGYALRTGMRHLYMLDGAEVEFHLEPMWKDQGGQWYGALTFIDDAVGGSGFLDRAAAELHLVARRALEHLDHEGCDAACYRCLKSYRNQRHHSYLSWPHALPDLEHLATGSPVSLPIERIERDDSSVWLKAYEEGVGSPLELKFLKLFRKHGLAVETQISLSPRPGEEPISVADFVIKGERTAIYVDGAAFHRGEALRRDRLIRRKLRDGGFWKVAELRASDLGEGRRLIEALRRGEGRWFEPPTGGQDRMSPDDVAKRLRQRGCRLYHAINLLDFETYVREWALLARSALEGSGKPFTPFRSDQQDKDKGLWARTFGNLADFGQEFWQGKAPNVYGPITLVFGPEVFAAVDDIAVTRRGAMKADFDLASERISSLREIDALFEHPVEHPLANQLTRSCTFAEVSVNDEKIGFEHLEKIVVEPVTVGGVSLCDRVREIVSGRSSSPEVVGRDDEARFSEQAAVYAAIVAWAESQEGNLDERTLPDSARSWYESLSSGRRGALRPWGQYIWSGTILAMRREESR